jgi:cold shock CspA family protein
VIWSISLFNPSGMYGFAANPEGDEVFFHAQSFHRLEPGEPLPILGEQVEVTSIEHPPGNRPRAGKVLRLARPSLQAGQVKSFDSHKKWGFVEHGPNQVFLHLSECMMGWFPVVGAEVEFYLGSRKNKPRACWARPAHAVGTVAF